MTQGLVRLDKKCEVLHIYWSLQWILAVPYCWWRYPKDSLLHKVWSLQMGYIAHGAYEIPCHIYTNHEQPVFQHVEFWHDSISRWHPCVLAYGIRALHIIKKSTGMLIISIRSTVSLRSAVFYTTVQYSLGFNIMLEGIHISNLKVWSLNEWPVPTTVK